ARTHLVRRDVRRRQALEIPALARPETIAVPGQQELQHGLTVVADPIDREPLLESRRALFAGQDLVGFVVIPIVEPILPELVLGHRPVVVELGPCGETEQFLKRRAPFARSERRCRAGVLAEAALLELSAAAARARVVPADHGHARRYISQGGSHVKRSSSTVGPSAANAAPSARGRSATPATRSPRAPKAPASAPKSGSARSAPPHRPSNIFSWSHLSAP